MSILSAIKGGLDNMSAYVANHPMPNPAAPGAAAPAGAQAAADKAKTQANWGKGLTAAGGLMSNMAEQFQPPAPVSGSAPTVSPSPPGGGNDQLSRVVSAYLSPQMTAQPTGYAGFNY